MTIKKLIKKYGLLKNGCLDINKAIQVEKQLVLNGNFAEAQILTDFLNK